MAYVLLSETNDWKLVHDDQDVRGRDLIDASGLRIGQIADMVINTDTEHVEAVVLTDGARHPAADLDIEGEAVYLRGAGTAASRQPYRYQGLRRSDAALGGGTIGGAAISGTDPVSTGHAISGTDAAGMQGAETVSGADREGYLGTAHGEDYDDDDRDYETHYGTSYHVTGNPYSFYRPAYRFGRDMSGSPGLLNTSFEDIEPTLRERWTNSFPGLRYDDFRGAIRFGFERRRNI